MAEAIAGIDNLFSLTDSQISEFHERIKAEIGRRSHAAISSSRVPDPSAAIRGQDYAKRAISVALAGGHSVLFVGPPGCGKTMLRALAWDLGLRETFEAWSCPCGHKSDPRKACRCESGAIGEHLKSLPVAEIVVECTASHAGLLELPRGKTSGDFRAEIARLDGRPTPTSLHREAATLLKMAAGEIGLDLRSIEAIRSIAASIGRLEGCDAIRAHHVAEAIGYRPFDRSF